MRAAGRAAGWAAGWAAGILSLATAAAAQQTQDRFITDTLTVDEDTVRLLVEGRTSVVATVSGTWSQTLVPEVSGTAGCELTTTTATWTAATFYTTTNAARATSVTANGRYAIVPLGGARCARVRTDAFTSGTATVLLRATVAPMDDPGGAVALAAGTSNIGDVDVASFPAAATVDTALAAQAADFDVKAATANMRLVSWTARESAGTAAAATVVLRHGVLSGGNCTAGGVIAYIELAPNESVGHSYDARGLAVASGVCADVIAGTVDVGIATVTEAAP